MHSHDRTLLSQLGFADRDKQNPLHDLDHFVAELKREGVRVITLGPKFYAWAEQQKGTVAQVEEL